MGVKKVLAFRNRIEEKKHTDVSENVSKSRESVAKKVIEIQRM